MSNKAQFKISITDIDPATRSTITVGEIDLFAFSEAEVYALYSGKGLNGKQAKAYINQLKKLLRKPQVAPNSELTTCDDSAQDLPRPFMPEVRDEKLEQQQKQMTETLLGKKCIDNGFESAGPKIVQPNPALYDSIAEDIAKAILTDDYALAEEIFKGQTADGFVGPDPLALRVNRLLESISTHRENRRILVPRGGVKIGCNKLRQRIEVAALPEHDSPEILHAFFYERRI